MQSPFIQSITFIKTLHPGWDSRHRLFGLQKWRFSGPPRNRDLGSGALVDWNGNFNVARIRTETGSFSPCLSVCLSFSLTFGLSTCTFPAFICFYHRIDTFSWNRDWLLTLQSPFHQSLTYVFSLPTSEYVPIINWPLGTFRMICFHLPSLVTLSSFLLASRVLIFPYSNFS